MQLLGGNLANLIFICYATGLVGIRMALSVFFIYLFLYQHSWKQPERMEAPSWEIWCDFEGKNKEILLCWRETLPSMPGNKCFFQA